MTLTGHAGYDAHGRDIVCAAVSAAADLTVHLAESYFGVRAEVSADSPGNLHVSLPGREEAAHKLFSGLREDLEAMALGFYFAELTEAVTAEEVPAPELTRHLLNGLYAISTLHKPLDLVKPAFELRLLCLAGYEPLADTCAYCGREEPEDPMLDVVQGVLHCRRCGQAGAAGRLSMPLCADSLAALRHIVYGDPKRLYSFRLGGAALERLRAAAEAFTAAQLERGFRTLDFYKGLRPVQMPSK